jgi:hypothetical protein
MDKNQLTVSSQNAWENPITQFLLQSEVEEAEALRQVLAQRFEVIQKKTVKANTAFSRNVQQLQTELNGLLVQNSKKKKVSTEELSPWLAFSAGAGAKEMVTRQAKRIYYVIAKELYDQGHFRCNTLMGQASRAYQQKDMAILMDMFDQAMELTRQQTNQEEQPLTEQDQFLAKVRLLSYLKIAVDVLQDKIIEMESQPVYQALKGGSYDELVADANRSLQNQIDQQKTKNIEE